MATEVRKKKRSNPLGALVSSDSQEWGTPDLLLDRARVVLGGIDLDLASSAQFNERVRAQRFFSEQDPCPDSLPAAKGVFCNPPGDGGLVRFWRILTSNLHNFDHAIFVSFSLESVYTTQGDHGPSVTDFPHCFPAARVRYNREDGSPGGSPPRGSLIVYVPGRRFDKPGMRADLQNFIRHFGDLGICHWGRRYA